MKRFRRTSEQSLAIGSAIALIRAYQLVFSPDRGIFKIFFPGTGCRFFPSCSEYAVAAISQYGLFRGVMASAKRIGRCNPWNAGGHDPA